MLAARLQRRGRRRSRPTTPWWRPAARRLFPGVEIAAQRPRGARRRRRRRPGHRVARVRGARLGAWSASHARPHVIDGRNVLDAGRVARRRALLRRRRHGRPAGRAPASRSPPTRPGRAAVRAPPAACAQAVVLVGGEGTRLRPITSRVPKPVVPARRPAVRRLHPREPRPPRRGAGRLLGRLSGRRSRGRDRRRRAASASPCATSSRTSRWARPAPSRTPQAELDGGCLFAFNGDVLTDVDLTAMAAFHGSARAGWRPSCSRRSRTRAATAWSRSRDDGSVSEFLEKPGAEYACRRRALINAGVYVLEPEVLDMIPAGRALSIERGVFPRLAAAGRLYALRRPTYWRDIGTPDSYLEAHFDLLQHTDRHERLERPRRLVRVRRRPTAVVAPGARVVPPAHVAGGTTRARRPRRTAGRDRRRLRRRRGRRGRRVGRCRTASTSGRAPRSSAASWCAAPPSARTATW